jgi:hypothetical protein
MSTFTKKYLIEVIDKRIADLGEPGASLSADEQLLRQMYRENAVARAHFVLSEAQERIENLAEELERFEQNPSDENFHTLVRANDRASSIDRYNERGTVHNSNTIHPIEERVRIARRKNPANVEHEKRRLLAAKKYITESPDTEFSLTLMRNLGFLDVIKGALNA